MRLLPKTALTVGITVSIGLSVIFLIAGTVLRGDIIALEQDNASHDGLRVAGLMQDDLRDLEWSAQELASITQVLFLSGDESQGAAADANQTTALFNSLFSAGDIDSVYFRSDEFGWMGFGFDLTDPRIFVEPPLLLNESLQESSIMEARTVGEPDSAAYSVGGKVYLIASYPLFSPDGAASMIGVVRNVDAEYLADLDARAHESISVYAWGEGLDGTHDAWQVASGEVHFERLARDAMALSFRIDGPDEQPVGLVRFTQDRAVVQEADQSLMFFVVASVVVSALLLAAALFILRKTVTGRVDGLGRRMRRIARKADWSARVGASGGDEVASLADAFNELMASLDANTHRLQRSNRDLEAFAHVVSHDLKSPMSTFNLNLHLMEKQAAKANDEEACTRIRRMRHQLDGMRDRIDAILAYSRSHHSDPQKRRISMDQVVDRVADDLESMVVESDAKITADELPHVHADPDQIALVMQNLIANACKFHRDDEPPRIHISSERRGAGWAIHVEDSGVGFQDQDVATMFQAFGRLDATADRDGHGIGLATCVRIMERHGGRMEASGRPGQGARFTVWIPDEQTPVRTRGRRASKAAAARRMPQATVSEA